MRFRFAARVIAQLGAELISSDDIAVYELIKNAFDAGSPKVDVEVEYLTLVSSVREVQEKIRESFRANETLSQVRELVRERLGRLPPLSPEWRDRLADRVAALLPAVGRSASLNEFLRLVGRVNTITIADTGHGMNEPDLERCFLTIGTTNRLMQHEATSHNRDGEEEDEPPGPAGEKGIGRLSAMRLGNDLLVRTWIAEEDAEHLLMLDWRLFSAESPLDANQIDVDAKPIAREHPGGSSGTVLTINDLQSHWDLERTQEVASRFLSRFVDPFRPQTAKAVDISWNGQPVEIPGLARRYLDAAHAGMKGTVKVEGSRRFVLNIDYWFVAREGGTRTTFQRTYSSADFEKLTDAAVAEIGPFSFEMYYYNRHRLAAIPGFASRDDWRKWLDEWAGGLMLYRDGLRVMPYGRLPDDDWLELDKRALRGKGYRVNRIQVVGCVRIMRARNPLLQDQTNREGLRDNASAKTFRSFLHRIIEDLFVPLLDQQTREEGKSDEAMLDRSAALQQEIEGAVDRLVEAAERSQAGAVAAARIALREALAGLPRLTGDLREAVQSHAIRRLEMIELAARGLSAASLAHDLEAALDQATAETGALARSPLVAGQHQEALTHLTSLFRSLRSLVADIKPGPAKTRRRKSTFDLGELLDHLVAFYRPRLDHDRIGVNITIRPKGKPFRVKAVEGHLRQILDNLFRNSIDWLVDTRLKHPTEAPDAAIEIRLDHRSKSMAFSDTGVGIAVHDAEWVFEAFTSHKEEGQGLGLYIAKELCEFNGIKIEVDVAALNQWQRCNQFILDLSACYVEGE